MLWTHADRYAYHADRPAWCVYDVLKDLGLRCAAGPFCVLAGRCPLRYREWLFRNDITYTELLHQLRRERDAAAAAAGQSDL